MTDTDKEVKFPLKLFVYGTLKRGYSNHRLLQRATFLKEARCHGILLHLNAYPGLLHSTTGMPVEGEVYEIPDRACLDSIDELEGHPDHYERIKIFVNGSEEVWTYVYKWFYYIQKNNLDTDKHSWKYVSSGRWVGPKSASTPFIGFYDKTFPPRTPTYSVAHVRIEGVFAGMVDCFSGSVLRDNWRAEGKPHFVYDRETNLWVPAKSLESVPPASTKAATPQHSNIYKDTSDPGEIDLPAKQVA